MRRQFNTTGNPNSRVGDFSLTQAGGTSIENFSRKNYAVLFQKNEGHKSLGQNIGMVGNHKHEMLDIKKRF